MVEVIRITAELIQLIPQMVNALRAILQGAVARNSLAALKS
jgi:hypothetical protein